MVVTKPKESVYAIVPEGTGWWIEGSDYTRGFASACTMATIKNPKLRVVYCHAGLVPGFTSVRTKTKVLLEIRHALNMNVRQLVFTEEAHSEPSVRRPFILGADSIRDN